MPITAVVRLAAATAASPLRSVSSWRPSCYIAAAAASRTTSASRVRNAVSWSKSSQRNVVVDHWPRRRSIRGSHVRNVASLATASSAPQEDSWLWQGISVAVLAATAGFILQRPNSVTMMESNAMTDSSVGDVNVSIWQRNGRIIYLVGSDTSFKSSTLAGEVVKDVRPQAVFVELDLKSVMLGLAGGIRLSSSSASTTTNATATTTFKPETPNIKSDAGPLPVIGLPAHKVLVTNTTTTSANTNKISFREPNIPPTFDLSRWNYLNERLYQYSYTVKTDNAHPRGEAFANAMKEGLQVDATIVLGDVDAERTRQQADLAWRSTEWTMSADEWSLLRKTLRSDHDGSQEALETSIKKVKLLKRHAPKVHQAVLEERDEYMATGLDSLKQFKTVVAVMGAVHVVGVAKHLLELGWKPVAKNGPTL